MELSEQHKEQLRQLVASPQWKTFLEAKNEWQKEKRSEPLIQSTPTETMVHTYRIDGLVTGIDEFIRQVIETL